MFVGYNRIDCGLGHRTYYVSTGSFLTKESMQIIWLTGQSGAGKTTLAKALQKEWPCLILDGNEMRDSISTDIGFSRDDRTAHNFRVARLAKELSKQTNVVVSVIAPIRDVRDAISRDIDVEWIYIKRTLPEREGHFYEESTEYFTFDHDCLTIKESVGFLRAHLTVKKKYSLFIGRWQPLHSGHLALFNKVRQEGRNILIAIRDTEIDENNPLSADQRQEMIQEQVPDAKVIIIPDIEEVCFGRGVGYGIREIRLDEETEKISATSIRRKQ